MVTLAWILWAVGIMVCGLNLYLSVFRYRVHQLRSPTSGYRSVSGIPALGSMLVIVALVLGSLPECAFVAGIALALADTGGLHWFVGTLAWHALKART
jgi:hypothetical protein